MNAVDKVKTICKERGIPISRLERNCGFSNGYVRIRGKPRNLSRRFFDALRVHTLMHIFYAKFVFFRQI